MEKDMSDAITAIKYTKILKDIIYCLDGMRECSSQGNYGEAGEWAWKTRHHTNLLLDLLNDAQLNKLYHCDNDDEEWFAELEALRDFVRSLHSLAFEEWHGLYYEDQFHIYDDDSGKSVARGADAYEAWKEFVKNENK